MTLDCLPWSQQLDLRIRGCSLGQGQVVTLAIINQQTNFEVRYEKSGTLRNLLKVLEPQTSPFDYWMVESLEEGVMLAMKEEDSFS